MHVGARALVSGLSVEFAPGEVIAILGCNGSGKTLTLHTLAGLRPPRDGALHLDGIPFDKLSRRAVALRLGLLAQDLEDAFVTTALEMVLIRTIRTLRPANQWETTGRRVRISRESLAAVGLIELADRRRYAIRWRATPRSCRGAARNGGGIFLLDRADESSLDPHHQIGVLGLFRELAPDGSTVITTLHEPTLAARFADRVLLLFGDGRWSVGPVT